MTVLLFLLAIGLYLGLVLNDWQWRANWRDYVISDQQFKRIEDQVHGRTS